MDREPKPAPFPVGARVRQVGPRRSWSVAPDRTKIPVEFPGMEVIITEVRPGRRGTLRPLPGDWDDLDEVPLDTTRDGYSVFVDPAGHGKIIWPQWADQWEVVP